MSRDTMDEKVSIAVRDAWRATVEAARVKWETLAMAESAFMCELDEQLRDASEAREAAADAHHAEQVAAAKDQPPTDGLEALRARLSK